MATSHYSYSRVETFIKCPYAYKLKYKDELETIPCPDANDAQIIGSAMHAAIEGNSDDAIDNYYKSFSVIDNAHVEEAIKVEVMSAKVKELLATQLDLKNAAKVEYEVTIDVDKFLGFIDLRVQRQDGSYELYDFKYSNHKDKYAKSAQLHVYQYFSQKLDPTINITKLGYIMIPKVGIRLKKTEDIPEFRQRLWSELENKEPEIVFVKYDEAKVIDFLSIKNKMLRKRKFNKTPSTLCVFCNFQQYCTTGNDSMLILPKNVRRVQQATVLKRVWIYGQPFSGKTFLADHFPSPIFLSTDGNINSFTAQPILLKDKYEGPMLKQTAWEVFKEAVQALKLDNAKEYKTIVVDLLEDVYDDCRKWAFLELGIKKEADQSFVAYNYIRSNFFDEIRKLTNLPYNIVLISHEDNSRDLTAKNGDKVSTLSPNIQNKVALKVAGMVDLVMRITSEKTGRFINFKADEHVFGGGRIVLPTTRLPCDYASLDAAYNQGYAMAQQLRTAPAPSDALPTPIAKVFTQFQQEEQPKITDETLHDSTMVQTGVNGQLPASQEEWKKMVERKKK